MRLSDLWRWNGTIERGPYLAWGLILFAIKFNIDRFLSQKLFLRSWSIVDYQHAGQMLWDVLPSFREGAYYSTLVAASLPFLWAGIVLTLKRLRSAVTKERDFAA